MTNSHEMRLKYHEVTITNSFELIKSMIQMFYMEQQCRQVFLEILGMTMYIIEASPIIPWILDDKCSAEAPCDFWRGHLQL